MAQQGDTLLPQPPWLYGQPNGGTGENHIYVELETKKWRDHNESAIAEFALCSGKSLKLIPRTGTLSIEYL